MYMYRIPLYIVLSRAPGVLVSPGKMETNNTRRDL